MKLFDFFILRTPVLLADFPTTDPIAVFSSNRYVREAILISSFTLYTKASNIVNGIEKDPAIIGKVTKSLRKYLKRFRYRCTPFGMSAGITAGKISDRTEMHLAQMEDCRRHVRADMGLLSKLYRLMLNDEELKRHLKFFPNNTLYKLGNTSRYLEYIVAGKRNYNLSSFQADETIELILKKCRGGRSLAELHAEFEGKGYELEEVKEFLNELISEKILISELEPNVTGEFHAVKMVSFLKRLPFTSLLKEDILSLIADLQGNMVPNEITEEYYSSKIDAVNRLGIEEDDMFQVDLYRPASTCTLDKASAENINEAHRIIYGLNNGRTVFQHQQLRKFIEEFEKRYEGKEMPLTLVMDPDVGIGYPANAAVGSEDEMIRDLHGNVADIVESKHASVFDVVLKRFQECISRNESEIVFTESDLEEYGINVMIDNCMSSLVSILKCRDGERILHIASESSGLNIASRFLHMPEVNAGVQKICDVERSRCAKTNGILAEVTFLPDDRVGNIIYKQQLWDYEIPIVAPSGLPESCVIALDDLRVSVKNGLLVLRDAAKDKFIFPRFSCLYDHYKSQVPLLSFLADYRYQFAPRPVTWLWGSIMNRMPYLPRVTYKNVILSRAKWSLSADEVKGERAENLIDVLKSRGIPEKLCIALDDNVLPLDLTTTDDRELFLDELKRYRKLTILEDLEHSLEVTTFAATDNHLPFRNEVVLFWENPVQQGAIQKLSYDFKSQKEFLPGDKWMYWKIYCGAKSLDSIVTNSIMPLVQHLLERKMITKWFFIRYADPDFHLRLRLEINVKQINYIRQQMNSVLSSLFSCSMIWNVKEDIYMRELIRYGDENITNAEALFYHDSECVALLLLKYDLGFLDANRWKFGVLSVDRLLSDFGFDLPKKIAFIKYAKLQFIANLQVGKAGTNVLKNNYRKYRKKIEDLLDNADKEMEGAQDAFHKRSKALQPIISNILSPKEKNAIGVPLHELLLSFTHMFLNRLFISNHKRHEIVVYDFLEQNYLSKNARLSKRRLKPEYK